MDGVGSHAAHAECGVEGVGAGAQGGHGAQILHTHLLFLQGVLVCGAVAQDLHAVGVQLKGLLCLRGQDDAAHDAQAAVQAGVDDLLVVCQLACLQHDLQGLEAAAVRQGDEADVLGITDVLGPAAHGDHRAVGGSVLVQRDDLSTFHLFSSDIKIKRQLCPEFSGRTSCLVMSAVPPELPEVSGRSRALCLSAVPVTLDLRRTYLTADALPCSVCCSRVFVHAAHGRGSQLCRTLWAGRPALLFPFLAFAVLK